MGSPEIDRNHRTIGLTVVTYAGDGAGQVAKKNRRRLHKLQLFEDNDDAFGGRRAYLQRLRALGIQYEACISLMLPRTNAV